MKKYGLLGILFLTLAFSCKKESSSPSLGKGNSDSTKVTIDMGNNYANDVYYSLTDSVVASVPRTNWDIAFNTNTFSPTILTNGGAGIKLYTYPNGDTAAWNSLSNANIANISAWPVMYNSDTTWTFGAFQRNTLASNPFDYGWGVYDYSNTHDIIGDSIFVIQLQDQTYRKLWIKRKASVRNTYIFQYANLDGSGLKIDSVNCTPYTNKNFIYYSIGQEKLIDREPVSTSWDFVATKYMANNVPYGNITIPYIVTGILSNIITTFNPPSTYSTAGTLTAKLTNVDVTTTDYSSAHFSTDISTIGWDWAIFDQGTMTYSLQDKLVYFLKNRSNNVYKIVITSFVGSSTGVIKFNQTKLN